MRSLAVMLIALMAAAGCGAGDNKRPAAAPATADSTLGSMPASPAATDQCNRLMAKELRAQIRNPATSPTDRRQARLMLHAIEAEQNSRQAPGEFNSGCSTITIPTTNRTP